MNRIHIARNRQSLGQFSPEEVAEGLASGKFLATDLGWREPMEQWMPLSEFTDLPQVVGSNLPPALPEAPPEAPPEPAWERRRQLGTLSALTQSVRQVLSVPVATFKAMKREGGLATPLFFYLIVSTLTSWVAMGYQLAVVLMNPEGMLGPLAKSLSTTSIIGVQIISMALVPILIAATAFCAAGILHLVFMLLGNSGQSFEVTFRSYCYAVAPASIFRLIPICGDVFFFVTALVLLIFALRETLRVDGVRATIGVVLPALLCCGFFWAGAVLAAGALAQGVPR
ncbi:MAG TPA: YIP1 family protein [Terrimicrobiaceae bacterium]|nr:YIP1 family protein [Terrimicrobiaceae bacterium]